MDSFPFTRDQILYGGILPVVAAFVVMTVIRRVLPRDYGERYSAPVATLTGFLLGYGLLQMGSWVPATHWHWLPHAMCAAVIVGPVACASGVHAIERNWLYLVLALVAGWFLIPTWEDLTPSRSIHLVIFTVYVVMLGSLLDRLTRRLDGPLLPTVLWLSVTAASVVLVLSGSLLFALIALAGASALFGVVLVACFSRDKIVLTGLVPLFGILTVGLLLIGRVNSFSEVPAASYMLIPIAPLLLWGCFAGPLSRLTGVRKFAICLCFPVVLLAVAVILAFIADLKTGGEY